MSLLHAILGVLEARPMNGYELAQFFDTQAGWVWSAPRSQIYPQLRKMEEAGLVAAESQIRGTKLERRVYSVTELGLQELQTWVATPHDTTTKRDAVFLQALLFDLIEPQAAVQVLNHLIAQQERLIGEWRAHAERLRKEGSDLLRARLSHRPVAQHAYVTEIKARVFEGSVEMAKARLEWAREELWLIAEQARDGAAPPKAGRARSISARGKRRKPGK
jgi:DNA-binding PadR family transcriptional regulator